VAAEARLAFFTADVTAETVFTGTAGHISIAETIVIGNPSGGAATNFVLAIGTDGATTRVIVQSIPAGPSTIILHPNLKLVAAEVLQASSSATDDVLVVGIFGRVAQRLTAA
jgi:hypothetical protein